MNEFFRKVARRISSIVGSVQAFIVAVLVVVAWFSLGSHFHYSTTWQLVINTGTTIVTFIMVFIIQNTQNRDSKAMHLKMDELIHIHSKARNRLVELEEDADIEMTMLETEFRKIKNTPDRVSKIKIQKNKTNK